MRVLSLSDAALADLTDGGEEVGDESGVSMIEMFWD